MRAGCGRLSGKSSATWTRRGRRKSQANEAATLHLLGVPEALGRARSPLRGPQALAMAPTGTGGGAAASAARATVVRIELGAGASPAGTRGHEQPAGSRPHPEVQQDGMTGRGGRKARRRRDNNRAAVQHQHPSAPAILDEGDPADGATCISPPTSPVGSYCETESSRDTETPAEQPQTKPRRSILRSNTSTSSDEPVEHEQSPEETLDSIVDSIEAVAVRNIGTNGGEDNRVLQMVRDKDAGAPSPSRSAETNDKSSNASELHLKAADTQAVTQTPRRRRRRRRKPSCALTDDSTPPHLTAESESPPVTEVEAAGDKNVGDERQLPASERKAARALRKKAAKQQKRNRVTADGSTGRKSCGHCAKPECELLVRCESKSWSGWKLVCGKCWAAVSGGVPDGDDAHPDYRYGGLWRYRKLDNKSSTKRPSEGKQKSIIHGSDAQAQRATGDERSTLAGMAVLVALGQEP